jgi:phosphoglycolate phosphatase-like HAD superfamily hydrolase
MYMLCWAGPSCRDYAMVKILRLPPVRACLFDMDGLLIDSEEHYSEVTNTILQRYGKPNLPWSIKAQMQGRPGPQVKLQFTGIHGILHHVPACNSLDKLGMYQADTL